MQVKGRLTGLEQITQLSHGTTEKGQKWILLGTKLTVNSTYYGMTDFSTKILEKRLNSVAIGDEVEFEVIVEGGYTNVVKKTMIKVLEKGVSPTPEPESKPVVETKVHIVKSPPEPPDFEELGKKAIKIVTDLAKDSDDIEEHKMRVDVAIALINSESSRYITELIQYYKSSNMDRWDGGK